MQIDMAFIENEIQGLEQMRQQLAAKMQQVEGALATARAFKAHLLKPVPAEAAEKPAPKKATKGAAND